jgi:hypothetical protein
MRIAKRSSESCESENGWFPVVMAVMVITVLAEHCQIDAWHCQALPSAAQGCETAIRARRSAAINRAAAFCQLCSERCGTSVTSHFHASLATGSRPAGVAFCA